MAQNIKQCLGTSVHKHYSGKLSNTIIVHSVTRWIAVRERVKVYSVLLTLPITTDCFTIKHIIILHSKPWLIK